MYEVAKGTPVIGHGIAAGHAFAGRVKLRPFGFLPAFPHFEFLLYDVRRNAGIKPNGCYLRFQNIGFSNWISDRNYLRFLQELLK